MTPTFIGIRVTSNYATSISEDIPIQIEGELTNLNGTYISYFSSHDNSKFRQIPHNGYGYPSRYNIRLTVDGEKEFKTAYFLYESQYLSTLSRLMEVKNKNVIITYLPITKTIVRIEENVTEPRGPIYEKPSLLTPLAFK